MSIRRAVFYSLSNEQKSMFKSGNSRADRTWFFNLKILKMGPELFARGYTESAVDRTDHLAEAFVRENVSSDYDVVTTL